ncbi:MAG: PorV/PorQ family protein [Ignavibacteriales bacterium]|nr:PorV/PorQ family protein [Ignavibacteriales bacterium]
MKKIALLVLLVFGLQYIHAQTKVGTTAANFLNIPVGPKATGMGGAYIAEANDASALYWNPGGLSRLKKSEFTASFSEWLVSTNFNWFGFAYKLSDEDAFGFSINQLNYGEDDVTTEDNTNGTGEKWKAQDLAVSVTYARNMTDRFSIGGSIKYIRQQIYHESASAFAMDIGLLFYTQIKGLNIAMNISNFGTEMKMAGKDLFQPIDIDRKPLSGNNENIAGELTTDSWTLPLTFTVGLNYNFIETEDLKCRFETDAVYPNNNTSYLNVGGEAIYNDLVSARIGWNSLFMQAAEQGFCACVGVKLDMGDFYTRVDYSYNTFKNFDAISKIGVTVGF